MENSHPQEPHNRSEHPRISNSWQRWLFRWVVFALATFTFGSLLLCALSKQAMWPQERQTTMKSPNCVRPLAQALSLAVTIGVLGLPYSPNRIANAADNAKRLNVLFVTSDQHRWDAAGCYGSKIVKTPNMDRLAAEGIRFDAMFCVWQRRLARLPRRPLIRPARKPSSLTRSITATTPWMDGAARSGCHLTLSGVFSTAKLAAR